MIDNAVQYAPKGESIEVTLTKTETTALLTVKNPCKGICDAVRANMFNCYTRELHPDSGVFGVGIGMAVIQSAAAAHGGTVLLRECEGGSTQVTMTVPIKHSGKSVLHAPSITISVPQDDGTVMLSNVLPEKLYRPE